MITPVILCGGSGTRLWPTSRKSYPKQFSPLLGPESLFQMTARRLTGPRFTAPLVMTGAEFRFLVTDQFAALGMEDADILIEPAARNTAPAVLAAALRLEATPEALMLVAPSDHVIDDQERFLKAVDAAAEAARGGRLVTFGIAPDRAETGYGYLELTESAAPGGVAALAGFTEKPDAARAAEMAASGRHLWNAGLFLFRVGDILAAYEAHAPGLIAPCRAALDGGAPDLSFFRLGPSYAEAEDVSIDYAVMEKAEGLMVAPYDGGWSDLGSWDAIWSALGPDAAGVATSGAVTAMGCANSLLRSEEEGLHLVGLGLRNIVAVAMRDAVLVADMDAAQGVKGVVAALAAKGAAQAETFPRFHRPWGWYETLCADTGFQVKRIMVSPHAALSLQSHRRRAEHWIVVAGEAKVTIEDRVETVAQNQSVYIPLGAKHRLENPHDAPMFLIEVQTGAYFGEDDITRFEDVYNRV